MPKLDKEKERELINFPAFILFHRHFEKTQQRVR